MVFNLKSLNNFTSINSVLQQIIFDFKQSIPIDENSKVRYPGEVVLSTRQRNSVHGIPVFKNVWRQIEEMLQ
jgi:3-dehydro-L-gulonate 2-dehydrogenase